MGKKTLTIRTRHGVPCTQQQAAAYGAVQTVRSKAEGEATEQPDVTDSQRDVSATFALFHHKAESNPF
jgi:hypothetical protein